MQNNNFNNNNQNIRNMGHPWSLQADINQENINNIGQLENTDNYQQNQINDIINNQLPQKQNQLINHENRLANNENSINNINTDLQNKQIQIENLNSNFTSHDNFIKTLSKESFAYLGHFYEEVALGENTNNQNKCCHIKKKDLGLKGSYELWLKITIILFIGLFIFNIGSILWVYIDKTIPAKDLIYLIPADIILSMFLYFISSQHTYYKKMYMEYINRAVVAKTYLSILNGAHNANDTAIITKIVADTLFSRNVTDQGPELPIKEIIKIAEKVINK